MYCQVSSFRLSGYLQLKFKTFSDVMEKHAARFFIYLAKCPIFVVLMQFSELWLILLAAKLV